MRRIADEPMAKASVRDLPVLAVNQAKRGNNRGCDLVSGESGRHPCICHRRAGWRASRRIRDRSMSRPTSLTLAVIPITVVSAGVKSVLDIGATLERLETLSIPVIGYGTDRFPRFWLTESDAGSTGRRLGERRSQDHESPGRAWNEQGIVLANPIPNELAWDLDEHDRILWSRCCAKRPNAGYPGKR